MRHLAHHDHLTGALNRAGFWSAANELLQYLTVQRYPVAICMLDIDHLNASMIVTVTKRVTTS